MVTAEIRNRRSDIRLAETSTALLGVLVDPLWLGLSPPYVMRHPADVSNTSKNGNSSGLRVLRSTKSGYTNPEN